MQAVLYERGYASASTLGWGGSLITACVSGLGIPCAWITSRLGSRNTALIGALMAGAAQLATSFTFHAPIWIFFLAQTTFGIAYALLYWATNTLAAQFFARRKGLALGLVYSGSGLGGAAFAVGLSALERRVGLEWAVRTFALLAWALLVPSALLVKERVPATVNLPSLKYFRDWNFVRSLARVSDAIVG